MQVVLSGFIVRLLSFVQAIFYVGMAIYYRFIVRFPIGLDFPVSIAPPLDWGSRPLCNS